MRSAFNGKSFCGLRFNRKKFSAFSIARVFNRPANRTGPKLYDAPRANFRHCDFAIWSEALQGLTGKAFRLPVSGLLNLFNGPYQHLKRAVGIFGGHCAPVVSSPG